MSSGFKNSGISVSKKNKIILVIIVVRKMWVHCFFSSLYVVPNRYSLQ